MNCTETGYLEPLYRSGELDPKTMAEIDFHLSICSTCALRWKDQDQLDAALRDAVRATDIDASPVVERVRRQMQFSPRRSIRARTAAVMAVATLAGAFVLATIGLTRLAPPEMFLDAAEDHSAEVLAHEPREWVREPAAIEQLARRKLASAGLVEALAPLGYHIERAKVCSLVRQEYVHLVYSNGTREVSFFVRRREGEQVPGPVVRRANGIPVQAGWAKGLQVAGFQSSKLTVLVVSDVPGENNVRFAAHAAETV